MELQQRVLSLIGSLSLEEASKEELKDVLAKEGVSQSLLEKISAAIDKIEAEFVARQEREAAGFKEELRKLKKERLDLQKAKEVESLEDIRKQIQSHEQDNE